MKNSRSNKKSAKPLWKRYFKTENDLLNACEIAEIELNHYGKIDYDRRDQRVELLFRNEAFLADMKKVEPLFAFRRRLEELEKRWIEEGLFKDQPPVLPNPIVTMLALAESGWRHVPRDEWRWFFEKWDISDSWHGEKYGPFALFDISVGPRLYARVKDPGQNLGLEIRYFGPEPDGRGFGGCTKEALHEPRLYISIDPWTTQDDIKELFKHLPEMKMAAFGFVAESKRCFMRDLFWYDLHKLGFPPVVIAKIWADARPAEFRALLQKKKEWISAPKEDRRAVARDYIEAQDGLPQLVRTQVDRMQDMIDSLTR